MKLWGRTIPVAAVLAVLLGAGVARADTWTEAFQNTAVGQVACPTQTQCTVVGGTNNNDGVEVTFDPASPGSHSQVTLDPGNDFVDIDTMLGHATPGGRR